LFPSKQLAHDDLLLFCGCDFSPESKKLFDRVDPKVATQASRGDSSESKFNL
jgi:hypothetical protein